MTLYDPNDDLFEGQLGVDDDPEDTPRILLEYTIIGSKYASTVHSLDAIKASNANFINTKSYDKLRDEATSDYEKNKAPEKTGTFSVTVEFTDSR